MLGRAYFSRMRYILTRGPEGNEVEIDVDVDYVFHAGCRGKRDSLGGKANAGPPLEPDDEPEIEILSVKETVSGALIEDLSDTESADIGTAIWEELSDAPSNDNFDDDYYEGSDDF